MNDHTQQLIHQALHGQLTNAKREQLSAWITASPDNARAYYLAMVDELAIRKALGRQASEDSDTWLALDPEDSAAARALAELAKLHDEGLNQPIDLEAHRKQQQQHAITHRRVQRKARLILAGSLAALIAVAALAGLLLSALSQQPQPIVEQPADAIIVATLTDQRDAAWASGTGNAIELTIGDKLLSGTLLELTAGFAEITTNRGAIAIIEAPATLELLDNDNALRLHAGKLVGICETESSKGFLVRTPHMDITDLGTRFGVDASNQDATEVHVLEGSVEVSRSVVGSSGPVSRVLKVGQALRAEAYAQGFIDTQMQADRFAQRPGNLLLGTGQGQAEGEIDNHWRVVAVDGQPVTQHGGLILVPEHHGGTSDPNTSQWLKINDALNPPGKRSAVFTCRSSLDLPSEVEPTTHELVIRCRADFSVKAARVNGQSLPVPKNRIGNGDKWIVLTVTEGFTPGDNTIEIDVHEVFHALGKANSSSVRVEVEARPR